MASADRITEDVNFGSVQARTRDGSLAALSAIQQSTTGKGSALDVRSDNIDSPAARMRGAGTVLDVQDTNGTSRFAVGQSGVTSLTVASGGVTATGDSTLTGALDVDGFALGEATPDAHNIVAWTYDPTMAVNSIELTGGTVYLAKLHIPRTMAVTKLYWWMAVAGVTPTAGQNFGGLYSSAGTRLVTANADATVTATAGLQTLTIGSTTLTANTFVWAALVFNAATRPTVMYGSGATGTTTACNVGLTAATYRYATAGTSQTSLPSSITPASNSASLIAGPWLAVGA